VSSALWALISTEFRLRLRSPATWVAVAAFAIGFWFWLPSPDGRAVNLSWERPDGRLQTPQFSSHLVGLACGQLAGVILPLIGFYLVAGSIRADRRRNLGPILAATPLPSWVYLTGKTLAHAAYLSVLAAIGLATGALAFLVRGAGPMEWLRFIEPTLWVALPMALCVASLAILFDVTPGLRGAGGWVAWFFFFSFFVMALPAILLGGEDGPRLAELEASQTIVYDPSAMMSLHQLVLQSLPDFKPKSVASGHIVRGADAPPLETVDWPGVRLTGAFRRQRLGTALQALVPLLLALVLFDRFDPARRSGKKRVTTNAEESLAVERAASVAAGSGRRLVDLPTAVLDPSALRAVLAEVRLTFEALGRWRWLLLPVVVAPAVLPGVATSAVLLLIATPILATAGAREAQSGAIALVRGQPGVPASLLAWKGAAMAGFAALLTLPAALRLAIASPAAGATALAGAILLGLFAAACGSLTGGAKLFSGLHVTAIYIALNGLRSGDATGLLQDQARTPEGPSGVMLFGILVGLVGLAAAIREVRRA
jgi:ABC-type transport system involved in multi-copper enzyme maturation permease subunit